MSEINPELYARMEKLVRRIVTERDTYPHAILIAVEMEARAIVTLLPDDPVDPDLIAAREIAASTPEDETTVWAEDDDIRAGDHDDHFVVRLALAAIKQGRALQAGEAK